MKKILVIAIMSVILIAGYAQAQQHTPQKEAELLTKKAISYYKSAGRDVAFAEFSKPDGKFSNFKKDLYIFVYDLKGTCLAIGSNPGMIGKNLIDLKDADGVPIIRGFIKIVEEKGKGWYDYKWSNPTTKKIQKKRSYIEKIDNYIVGSGVYLP
ncbi:MAG: cache domain-containing protein [Syntrophales bacterium]|nr:cache domain-containing protein [Syntrophales bacterium]